MHDTPAFLETRADLEAYRKKHTNGRSYQHDASFYRWQRRRLGLLVDADGKPVQGRWSFDRDNRNPYDSDYKEPRMPAFRSRHVQEAKAYVERHFPDNFGTTDRFCYPTTHTQAERLLQQFVAEKLAAFGKFQDGISKDVIFGSHSVLSSSLNIGLLTPDVVITSVMAAFSRARDKKKLIGSVEAFLRQVIGWRSYVRFVYMFHGADMLAMNRLKHKNHLTRHWYDATTGVPIVDAMIRKAHEYAYLHHIERLMVMGNFALLLMIRPSDVYEWFMVAFVDSYEWVMAPNVYGMSQYALEGVDMMTRPYFSSSNYLRKMSDFAAGSVILKGRTVAWDKVWDALYYNFINKHAGWLRNIYATAMQVQHWDNMDTTKRAQHLKVARMYFSTYM